MKGIFYSMAAVLFIIPLVMLAVANLSYIQTESSRATSKIIGDKLASYCKSIDNDLPRAIEIMEARSVANAVIYMENNGTPLTSSQQVLSELMQNGTIYGSGSPSNFTLSSWTFDLQSKGMMYGFNTQIKVLNITFQSQDSYFVAASVQISLNATYPQENMGIYRVYNTTVAVSIEGYDDPLYTLGTNGVLKREIRRPQIAVNGSENFDSAVASGYYMPSQKGAGFLDRLEGRLVASGKYGTTSLGGLESVVFIPDLQANGIPIREEQTAIDYLYFNQSALQGKAVNLSAFSWLRIDSEHAAVYNLTLIP